MQVSRAARGSPGWAGALRELMFRAEPVWVVKNPGRGHSYAVVAGFSQLPMRQTGSIHLLVMDCLDSDQVALYAWGSVLRLLVLAPEHGLGFGSLFDACRAMPSELASVLWGRGGISATALGAALGVTGEVIRYQHSLLHATDSASILEQVLA